MSVTSNGPLSPTLAITISSSCAYIFCGNKDFYNFHTLTDYTAIPDLLLHLSFSGATIHFLC